MEAAETKDNPLTESVEGDEDLAQALAMRLRVLTPPSGEVD